MTGGSSSEAREEWTFFIRFERFLREKKWQKNIRQ